MVITFFFPSVKNTQDRLNNLVNFQRAYSLKSGQFSARDNMFLCFKSTFPIYKKILFCLFKTTSYNHFRHLKSLVNMVAPWTPKEGAVGSIPAERAKSLSLSFETRPIFLHQMQRYASFPKCKDMLLLTLPSCSLQLRDRQRPTPAAAYMSNSCWRTYIFARVSEKNSVFSSVTGSVMTLAARPTYHQTT